MQITVKTQAELDAACEKQKTDSSIRIIVAAPAEIILVLRGSSHAELRGSSHAELWESSHAVLWGSSHAELWESSHAVLRGSSHAELRGSSHAVLWESSHAELWESSHAVLRGSSHAVLWESSHAELWESSHAVLWGSSHAELRESSHAELWESSHAVLWGSSHAVARHSCVIKASAQASIAIHGDTPSVTGGIQIKVKQPETPEQWCEEYGAKVKDGVAILYKGVKEDFTTEGHTRTSRVKPVCYAPGTTPQAEDWDGGIQECGKGLHFSPSVGGTLRYNSNPSHFVACPVKLSDIAVHKNAEYPDKVKAKGICAPIWEVDRWGKKIKTKNTTKA